MLNFLKRSKKSKRVMLDMFINLFGTALPLIGLQLIVYPIVAKIIPQESYGQMQSLMSVIYLVSGTLGGALSTTRLVRNYDYKKANIVADFKILNIICSFIVLIVTPIVVYIYLSNPNILDIVYITSISVLNYLVLYFEVGFRLQLNYKKVFINKAIGCVGYFLGFIIFLITLDWQWIFITSFFLQMIYCVFFTNIKSETFQKSFLFSRTTKTLINLSFANLLNKALTYFDKLLLYPLLGGGAVSIYYAANIFGKLILQVLEPITNVILSYLSKEENVSNRIWKITIITGIVFCGVMYGICVFISEPILNIFYPQWSEQAMKYVPISTLSLCVSSFVNIIYPLTLKALNSIKQIIINGFGLVVYISITLFLSNSIGLMGCCIALLTTYIVKLILMLIFCFFRGKGK